MAKAYLDNKRAGLLIKKMPNEKINFSFGIFLLKLNAVFYTVFKKQIFGFVLQKFAILPSPLSFKIAIKSTKFYDLVIFVFLLY